METTREKWVDIAAEEIVRRLPEFHQPGIGDLAVIIWRAYTMEKGPQYPSDDAPV
jgi:hypothetical protein